MKIQKDKMPKIELSGTKGKGGPAPKEGHSRGTGRAGASIRHPAGVRRTGTPAFGLAAGGKGSSRGEDRGAGENSDEFLRVGVLGGAEDLRQGAAFDDFAGVENGDAMTQRDDR